MYDGPDLQSSLIAKFDRNYNNDGFLATRSISSVSSFGSHMLVQFVTDDKFTRYGFSARFQFKPINPICNNWMNVTTRFLISPHQPTIDCSWVITASLGSNIHIQFQVFEVNYDIFPGTTKLNKIYAYIYSWEMPL